MEIPEKYQKDFALIKATADQVEKDFMLSDFKIVLSGNHLNAFNEIKSQLLPFISRLYKESEQAFLALLYRVDISEKDYRTSINRGGYFTEEIAELIIRREFQKVLSKRYFSDHSE